MADENRLLTQAELLANMKATTRRVVYKMPMETVRKMAADDYSRRSAMGFVGAIGVFMVIAARERVKEADHETIH